MAAACRKQGCQPNVPRWALGLGWTCIHVRMWAHLWPAWPHPRGRAQTRLKLRLRRQPPPRDRLRQRLHAAPAARHLVGWRTLGHVRWWMPRRCWTRCWPPLCTACPGIGLHCRGAGWGATGCGAPGGYRNACKPPLWRFWKLSHEEKLCSDEGGARNLSLIENRKGGDTTARSQLSRTPFVSCDVITRKKAT